MKFVQSHLSSVAGLRKQILLTIANFAQPVRSFNALFRDEKFFVSKRRGKPQSPLRSDQADLPHPVRSPNVERNAEGSLT